MRNLVIAVVIVLVLAGGYFLVSNNSQTTNSTPSASSTENQTPSIKAGDKVVWTNNSGDVATVDSSKHPTHQDYPPLNLGQFQDGEKHELIFDEPGTYMYHDHLHATRFGKVVVE